MNNKTTASLVSLAIMSGFTTNVVADVISGSLRATSHISDNTLKQPDSEMPEEERQDSYDGGLAINYENSLVETEVSYQLHARKFAEHSQTDEEYVDGNSSLVIGKVDDPASLRLEHSRLRLLGSPDAIDLLQNQQEREIISALPELRSRIFSADYVFVRGQATAVRFPDNELQNSKRNGVVLGWIRPQSRVASLQFTGQQTEIKYDELPQFDYTYSTASVTYSVELRKLKYQIDVGYNRSEPEVGNTESAPSYNLQLGYESGYHSLDFSAGRELTDTSFGNGNTGNMPGNDGLTSQPERIDRIKADLRWSTEIICERCSFTINGALVEDEYLSHDQKSRNTQAGAAFGYALSIASSLNFHYSKTKMKFDGTDQLPGGVVMNNYDLTSGAIEYAYRFKGGVALRIFGRQDERVSDTEQGTYDENIYGAGIGYSF